MGGRADWRRRPGIHWRRSLYEAKRGRHPATYLFPSAVDLEHFAQARETQPDPPDQRPIPHPRLGWFGVIDERFDRDLLAGLAARRTVGSSSWSARLRRSTRLRCRAAEISIISVPSRTRRCRRTWPDGTPR